MNFDKFSLQMSTKRNSENHCTWTTPIDDALILSYHHEHVTGHKANKQFTQEAFTNIVKDLQEKFPKNF